MAAAQRSGSDRVEEIYIARSVRLSRAAPTEYCKQSRTSLPPTTFEDLYDFKAVATRPADGRVTSAIIRSRRSRQFVCGAQGSLPSPRIPWPAITVPAN